ncbi:Uncharacterised protein [Chlamydia trachomatis]|nr:Uncharacterised protein [Chlamydia trachomatis]
MSASVMLVGSIVTDVALERASTTFVNVSCSNLE